MKWLIECTTDLFNSTEAKPYFFNERCFGEDFISWLVERFENSTFKLEEPFQEDWGWATLARKDGETFSIGIGIMDESIGEVPARWLITVDKMRRYIVFGSKRSSNLDLLVDELEGHIRNDSKITDVQRYRED
jgi:hypothetical protein